MRLNEHRRENATCRPQSQQSRWPPRFATETANFGSVSLLPDTGSVACLSLAAPILWIAPRNRCEPGSVAAEIGDGIAHFSRGGFDMRGLEKRAEGVN